MISIPVQYLALQVKPLASTFGLIQKDVSGFLDAIYFVFVKVVPGTSLNRTLAMEGYTTFQSREPEICFNVDAIGHRYQIYIAGWTIT